MTENAYRPARYSNSAACMMVAATILPLAAGDASRYIELSLVLTLMTGLLCMLGGIAKFGVIANFPGPFLPVILTYRP